MALKPCRECGRDVSTEAPTCPQCGVSQPWVELAAIESRERKPISRVGLLLTAFGFIFVIGFVAWLDEPTDTASAVATSNVPSPTDSVAAAGEACRFLVRDKLVAPTEAEFQSVGMMREEASGTGAFVGRGEVTAPNGLGVPITNRFVCVVEPNGSRGTAYFRGSDPEMYDEIVRTFGL